MHMNSKQICWQDLWLLPCKFWEYNLDFIWENVCGVVLPARSPPPTRLLLSQFDFSAPLRYKESQFYSLSFRKAVATTSCKNTWVFWLKLPAYDIVLAIPPPPLIKASSSTRPCSKLSGTTVNGERGRWVLYLTDVWLAAIWSKEGLFFVGVSHNFYNCCGMY